MDVSDILDGLNEAQRSAVAAERGNQLVLAGAGSGKTRVLVHRIAWLIRAEGVSPYAVMAVTFTNKAAKEMRGRIEEMLGRPTHGLWIGTFHGLAHRLLQTHWAEAGLPQNFQILDSDDQLRLVKRVCRELGLDDAKWPPKQAQWFINGQKDEGLRAKHIDPPMGDLYTRTMVRIYEAYEEACQRGGLVDFAELLLRAHELWLRSPETLKHYHERFNILLVDEFQDTNSIQYAWLRVLAGEAIPVVAVGDDDQSIYGWRGAKIENIQRFTHDFKDTQTVRLEQNYRSTKTILDAANGVIGITQDVLVRTCGLTATMASPSSFMPALMSRTRLALLLSKFSPGPMRETRAGRALFCIARMRSRGSLKRRLSVWACPIEFTAVNVSMSVSKFATRSLI